MVKIQASAPKPKSVSEPDGSMAKLLAETQAAERRQEPVDVSYAAEQRPSQFETNLRAKLRNRKQFQFGLLPVFVIDAFKHLAEAEGLTNRAYFYKLLREKGVDIPPDELMDGRKL